jgi:hypothetical protein
MTFSDNRIIELMSREDIAPPIRPKNKKLRRQL